AEMIASMLPAARIARETINIPPSRCVKRIDHCCYAMMRRDEMPMSLKRPSCVVVAARSSAMSELSEKQRDSLDEDQFAFPKERKEPLNNASHVRNAIARFDQVEGVSDDERDEAWKRIKKAADKYGVELSEESWRELGKK